MLSAIEDEFAKRRSTTDELLRTLIGQTRLIWRQLAVSAGAEDPGELEIRLPSDPPPPPKQRTTMRDLARQTMRRR